MFKKRKYSRQQILQEPRQSRGGNRWLWFTITGLCLLSLLAPFVEAGTAEQNAEAETGQLLMRAVDKQASLGPQQQALHLDSQVNFDISGMIAKVSLTQRFRNDSADWQEGIYTFPLPETAAVNGLKMQIGERTIIGKIAEKQRAQKIYRQAKKAGQKASLVAQQRPNLFRQQVANIAPGETVEIQLSYIQKVIYRHGRFSLRFPMTLTPRYIPGSALSPLLSAPLALDNNIGKNTGNSADSSAVNSEQPHRNSAGFANTIDLNSIDINKGWGWAAPTRQVPDAPLITPPMRAQPAAGPLNPISISARLDAGLPLASIDSDYHNISLRRDGRLHHIQLAEQRVSMDRDFVLNWQPVQQRAPAAAVFHEQVDGQDYALIMLLPQANTNGTESTLPREMIFIIDTSGSMGGTSIEQAKQSLQLALLRLRPSDKFNIIEFNASHRSLFPSSMPAEQPFIQQAQSFVGFLNAGGGTEMSSALNAALSQSELKGYLRQVVFITDGSVGNEASLFSQIQQQLASARLFTVGIGSAPNSHFMTKAAQFGRGSFTYIGSLGEVKQKMSALFQQLQSPQLSDITLEWPAGQSAEVWPQRLPDLYRGQPLLISAKLSQSLQGQLRVRGRIAKAADTDEDTTAWQQKLSLEHSASHPGIASLWARDKIAALMDKKIAGASEAEIKPQVLAVALPHQLVSAYSSFVAVEQRRSRPADSPQQSEAVANAIPRGQTFAQPKQPARAGSTSSTTVSYPRTATLAPLHIGLASGCLLLALLLRIRRR